MVDGSEASKEQEQMLVSRSWFSERGFQSVVSQNMVSQSKFGKLYVSESDKCV